MDTEARRDEVTRPQPYVWFSGGEGIPTQALWHVAFPWRRPDEKQTGTKQLGSPAMMARSLPCPLQFHAQWGPQVELQFHMQGAESGMPSGFLVLVIAPSFSAPGPEVTCRMLICTSFGEGPAAGLSRDLGKSRRHS